MGIFLHRFLYLQSVSIYQHDRELNDLVEQPGVVLPAGSLEVKHTEVVERLRQRQSCVTAARRKR